MLTERSQSQKDNYCSRYLESQGQKAVIARGWGRGDGELLLNGFRVPLLQDEKRSGDWRRDNVNVLNSTELCT